MSSALPALGIPCLICALGVHALAAALAIAWVERNPVSGRPEEPVFRLTLGPGALLPNMISVPPAIPICGGSPVAGRPAVLLHDLKREIEVLGRAHAWAGEYVGLGRHLYIAPHSGAWLDQGGGTRTYRVSCDEFDGTTSILAGERNYVPVHWGQRHYLIDVDEWSQFVKAVRTGTEPRSQAGGRFLLRAGDERLPVEDVPLIMGSP